jgi:hypothetical protein
MLIPQRKRLQIERHLALGGSDNPGEILLTFLFRYGDVPGFSNVSKQARTSLSQLMVITSGDGSADMGNVFQVQNCITVFAACWHRLQSKLKRHVNPEHSLLRYIVDPDKLQSRRRKCYEKASLINRLVPRGLPNPTLYTRSTRQTFSSGPPAIHVPEKNHTTSRRSNPPEVLEAMSTDEEAEQLKAGYGESTKSSKASPKAPKRRKRSKSKDFSRRL